MYQEMKLKKKLPQNGQILSENEKSELCQDLDGNVMFFFFVMFLTSCCCPQVGSDTIATARRVQQIIVAVWWLPGLGHSKKWHGVT